MKSLLKHCVFFVAVALFNLQPQAGNVDPKFPTISYIQYPSYDIVSPGKMLMVGGQLRIPPTDGDDMPAVVILHGSAGVDSRGTLYARALNDAGLATLEIDMWGARGIAGGGHRPPLPTYTLPDAFGALHYLANTPGIDKKRIGVLGFSWGGVMSLLAAEKSFSDLGNGHQFAAHVAHYPVCWSYNAELPLPGGGSIVIPFKQLTGAPVLIQVGSLDDYDEGGAPCKKLAELFPDVSVRVYPDAHHGWDRLQPPLTVQDPFSHLGAGGTVNIIPDPGQARHSAEAVVNLFANVFDLTAK